MVQVAMIGIVVALLALQLKAVKSDYTMYVILGGSLLIFFLSIEKLQLILEIIKQIEKYLSVNQMYLTTLMKMVGGTYISEFAANICRDTGNSSTASQIEVFAKLMILSISAPIILALIETLNEFLA